MYNQKEKLYKISIYYTECSYMAYEKIGQKYDCQLFKKNVTFKTSIMKKIIENKTKLASQLFLYKNKCVNYF